MIRSLLPRFLPRRRDVPSRPFPGRGPGFPRACGALLAALLASVPPPPSAQADEGGPFISIARPAPPSSASLTLPSPAQGPDTHPISDLFIENPRPAKPTPLPAGSFAVPAPVAPAAPRGDMPTTSVLPAASVPSSVTVPVAAVAPSAPPLVQPAGAAARAAADPKPATTVLPPPGAAVLDLNTATEAQLAVLPGLDSNRARLIVAHRTAIRGFQRVDQLQQVFGISEPLYARIAPLLRASPPAAAGDESPTSAGLPVALPALRP